MIATLAAIGLCLFVALALFAVILEWRYPMREVPYEKFNSFIPVLLGAAGCSFLGFIFYRRHYASSALRTHEWYHWMRSKEMGRWEHLAQYLLDFGAGLMRHGFKTIHVPEFGRRYLMAYWLHPEEVLARAYETYAHPRPALGTP